jgi:serine/threonine protein kinase
MVPDPLIGRQLGNYRLERLLGRGGMASVYYAVDMLLNRPAAVKVIDARFREEERFTARFIQEARAVAAWRHPNIVHIYYAGVEEGLHYFAMEFIEGATLAQLLKEQAAARQLLPLADVLRYGGAIASALDYAHQRGVIHRDVKPPNVLVEVEGRVVLSDFGLALNTSEGSLGEVFGSPRYIAPEQARRSNAAVPQSDLYSLGVILYEMLTGVVPFDDPSPASVALQQITTPPPPPSHHNPALGGAVEEVLLKALAKSPAERYASGAALMEALAAALRGLPGPSPHHPPAEPPTTPPPANQPPANQPPAAKTTDAKPPAAQPPAARPPDGQLPTPGEPAAVRRGARRSGRSRVLLILGGLAALLLLAGALAALAAGRDGPLGGLWPTLTPTATLTATATLTPTASPSPTPTPSRTPTPTPTPTLKATSAASATASPSPRPPSATPTLTASQTATPTPTFTPTLRYTDRRGFTLVYNATSFYMHQFAGLGDLVAGLEFERLDEDGQALNRFSAERWAPYASSSKLDRCFQLLLNGLGGYLEPPECAGKAIATLFLAPSNPEIFWTPQEGSPAFRVLWHSEELVRCAIAAGQCVVYLP